VGCTTCHGPVDKMPLMYQNATLQMAWCLDCHRNPEMNVRPRDQVFSVAYRQPASDRPVKALGKEFTDQRELGKALVAEYKIQEPRNITSCSTCHR
jgi:cytochrome c peroxidase